MKRTLLGCAVSAVVLSGCGNSDNTALKKEISDLKNKKAETEKEYESLVKENKKIDDEIKEKKEKLAELKEEKEKALKEQIKKEQEAEKKRLAAIEAEKEKKKQEEEKADKKLNEARSGKEIPNTIEASTNGKSKLVLTKKDIPIELDNNGINVNINRLQVFKVTEMPKGQVLLFNGKTDGYVILYEVTTQNNNDKKMYYNNNTKFTANGKSVYSDYASFIPNEFQEMSMKKNKNNFSEYAPNEKTTSYKSIAISEKDYEALIKGKASLVIQGGVSETKTFDNKDETVSNPYRFK